LREWLDRLPVDLNRGPGLPEAAFMAEPCSGRNRIRLWNQYLHGKREGQGDALCGTGWAYRVRALMEGTPQGRRMAGAVLYWRLMPEEPGPAEEWGAASERLLGRAIPPGPGCRERVLALLEGGNPGGGGAQCRIG
jgi:hypothetical protein